MKIVVISEMHQGERRVALVPDIAPKLAASGFEVVVEAGAGEQAGFTDDAYREIGVAIEADRQALLSTADVVLSVQPPRLEDVEWLRAGAASISLLQPPRVALPHSRWYFFPEPAGPRAWTRCPRSRRSLAIKRC